MLYRINESQRPESSFTYDWNVMNSMNMAYSQPPYGLPLPPYMPSLPRIPTFDSQASPPSWATELLVKKLCKETLNMDDADSLVFEKIHRLGKKSGDKARPILATFRYQEQRERVR